MNKLEMLSLEQVALHTKISSLEGVPVKKSIGQALISKGYAVKTTSPDYFKSLKRCDTLMSVKITPKGEIEANLLHFHELKNTFEQAMVMNNGDE